MKPGSSYIVCPDVSNLLDEIRFKIKSIRSGHSFLDIMTASIVNYGINPVIVRDPRMTHFMILVHLQVIVA